MEDFFYIIVEWGRNTKLRSHERLAKVNYMKNPHGKKQREQSQKTEGILATHNAEPVS